MHGSMRGTRFFDGDRRGGRERAVKAFEQEQVTTRVNDSNAAAG